MTLAAVVVARGGGLAELGAPRREMAGQAEALSTELRSADEERGLLGAELERSRVVAATLGDELERSRVEAAALLEESEELSRRLKDVEAEKDVLQQLAEELLVCREATVT